MSSKKSAEKDNIGRLREKCAELYDSNEDVEHVVQEAIKLGTVDAILNGTRRLPSQQDVATRHERLRRQADLDRNK